MVAWITTSEVEESAFRRGVVGHQSDAEAAMQAVQAMAAPVRVNFDEASFILPLSEQTTLVPHHDFSHEIPVIDLSGALDDTIAALKHAASSWGVFQVVNHGMPASTLNGMMAAAKDFFALPEEDKLASAPEQDVPQGYKQLAEIFHTTAGWSSVMEFILRPEHLIPPKEAYPSAAFRATLEEYGERLNRILVRLVELLLTAFMGPKSGQYKANELLDANHMQVLRIASYEPCPQPDAVMGIRSHVDHTLLSGLVQDDIGGLQVEKDGRWHGVPPLPGAIVVVVGSGLQIVTNDNVKAVNHRAVVNVHSRRISVTSAVNPSSEAVLFPAPEFIDEMHPPLYRPFKYSEFRVQAFEDGILKTRDVVEKYRITNVDAQNALPLGDSIHVHISDPSLELHDLLRFERAGISVA